MARLLDEDESKRERIHEALQKLENRFDRTTALVFRSPDEGKSLFPVGTGLFLELDGRKLFVTAGHVYDRREFGELFVSCAGRAYHLIGDTLTSNYNLPDREDDKIDTAVTILHPLTLDQIPSAVFLTEKDICRNPIETQRFYFMYGYPHEFIYPEDQGIIANPLRYAGLLIRDELRYESLGLNTDEHLLLGYYRYSVDREGEPSQSILPRGCSGGGLFSMGNLESLNTYDPMSARLAGLIIEFNPWHGAIIAVQFRSIIPNIKRFINHNWKGYKQNTLPCE